MLHGTLKKKPSLLWDLQYVVQLSWDISNAAWQNLEDKQEYRTKWFDSWVEGMVDSQPEGFEVTEDYLYNIFIQCARRMLPYNFGNNGKMAEFTRPYKSPGDLKALEVVVVSLK